MKSNATVRTDDIIRLLRMKIRGWGNYHRHVVAKETFYDIARQILWRLWRWAIRRHPNKSKG